jgi:hypothetical protein
VSARKVRTRKRAPIAPASFKRVRQVAALSVERCAQLLRVDPRTVRNWEAGRAAVPYSAYRLLRVESGQRLPGKAWRGWMLLDEHLVAPAGQRFSVHDMLWLSLSFRRAEAFSALYKRLSAAQAQQLGGPGGLGAGAPQEGQA